MNARNNQYHLKVEVRQVPEVVTCIFHSLLLHRSTAKFEYKSDSNFSLGSIGIKEVECDFIDLAYVRVNSDELAARLEEEVKAFHSDLEKITRGRARPEAPCHAQIGMEFYQRRKTNKFVFMQSEDAFAWELWNVHLNVFVTPDDDELARLRESAAEAVSEIILSLCSVVNKNQYVPKMPTRKEAGDVFDLRYSDVQPFLFNIVRASTAPSSSTGMASTMRKLVKDTLFI